MATQNHEKRRSAEEVAQVYSQRSERYARQAAAYAKGGGWAQKCYLTLLALAIVCFAQASSGGSDAVRWFVLTLVLLAAGGVGVILERRLKYRQRASELFHLSNEHGLARMGRCWEKVPVPRIEVPERDVAQAEDLDLFGHASLFHLLCRARTLLGITCMRDWLLEPAEPAVIRRRQQAVAELSSELSLRQEIEVRSALLGRDVQSFLQWVEGEPWLARRTWTRRLLFAQSAVPALSLLAASVGLVPTGVGVGTMCGACLVNLVITTFLGGRAHDTFRKAARRDGIAWDYLRLFELIARLPGTSAMIAGFRQTAGDPRDGAVRGLRGLAPIMVFGYAHRDPMKMAMYLPLQFFMLWDFHLLGVLERWQRRWSPHCRRWFETLGELEAVASLASLAEENPDWCFPDVNAETPKGLDAREVGHPLLRSDVCVSNDVILGPPGTLLLVSGSNMSGKSTLLRAIGVNIVLAQAGGPVCATRWTMSPVALATVVRIDDSLVDGVSLFLAGLYRIKDVVTGAKELSSRSDRTLVYLLDEPLQGTNARERRIATQKVLGLLLEHGAVGAVSSHDVELTDEESLKDACVATHFQETIDESQRPIKITFDYKLRRGMSTSTNALELVELVGLE